jgi:glucose-1-phosphate thymidylyltransferase
MKGVLICGGSGSRLKPLTDITNKSLLPVYDKPLILYPLQVLLDAGIKQIAVVSGNEHVDQMAGFLGSGSRFGCEFSYRVQDEPKGIAQALGLAESFVDGDSVCAILGDNVYFDDLSPMIQTFQGGAHLFLKQVSDAKRFGVATTAGDRVTSIVEKPSAPTTNLAVTGCYLYDSRCFDVIKNLKPSPRGELEITDVSNWYAKAGEARATILGKDWVDAGTVESLFRAAELVRKQRQATQIANTLTKEHAKGLAPKKLRPTLHK